MAKLVILFTYITISLSDIFTINCLSCHKNSSELKQFMANYTLKYSSETRVKKAMFIFLRNPTSNRSIMPYYFIKENGFKPKSTLTDIDLKKAIDIYYNKYKISNFIK